MAPRVRFAPAPTGYLHVGGAWLALYNWMFARRHGGTFVLRIEDTDAARNIDEAVHAIERGLRWLGIDFDEGPVRQSERLDRYGEVLGKLIADGAAYYCDCTRDAIQARTGSESAGYDGFCRDRDLAPGPGRALRFRVPDGGETVVPDLIRGDVTYAHQGIEDFVIARSDGSPSFYLPNAVDDVDMAITHVIRGEDLLSSTPRVLLVRRAMGVAEVPVFAHLPLLVDERRRKLSKRYHSVAIEDYRDKGYLAAAMRNYLALLGWSPRDGREVVPIEDMVAQFALEDVSPSHAFFDTQKLDHINAEYIRALPVGEFVCEALPWLETTKQWPPERFDFKTFEAVAPFVQERVRTLSEVPALVDFLFVEEPTFDEESWGRAVRDPAAAGALLDDVIEGYESAVWDASALHELTRLIGERHGLKLAKAQAPIRVAVTGRSVGPPLFESLQVMGRDTALERLRRARSRLVGT
jgi:glutamyl-tRNA synthetase